VLCAVLALAARGAIAQESAMTSSTRPVGGDAGTQLERLALPGGATGWRAGSCSITTPLPEGHPPPTPPGALEIKHYPSVRRAEAPVGGGGGQAFWLLFEHIQSRDIAMTSPVEIDLERETLRERTMSFLYREPDLAPVGTTGPVTVRDTEPVTVLALGQRGSYSDAALSAGLRRLGAWLEAQAEWEAVGAPRALRYNGPRTPAAEKWGEVQLEIRRRSGADAGGSP